MGLLNKTFDFAKKATGAVVDTASKKIAEAKQKKEEEGLLRNSRISIGIL